MGTSREGLQAELERLRTEHRALERRLAELDSHVSLTPAEQVERTELKKRKLVKKDQITRLERVEAVARSP